MKSKPANERFVEGIYNFCDRWCERCALADRCQLNAMEPPSFATPESRDPREPAFWNALSLCFAQANRRLREQADATGEAVDPDALLSPGGLVRPERPDEETDRAVRDHPLVVLAAGYARQAERWLDDHAERLAEHEDALVELVGVRLPGSEHRVEAEVRGLRDAIETILWYQHLIEIKLSLAVATRLDLDRQPGAAEPYAVDLMDGSAKVALIAVDRSLRAWRAVRDVLDDPADSTLALMSRLERTRRDAEVTFPAARDFRRPGLDDPALLAAPPAPSAPVRRA